MSNILIVVTSAHSLQLSDGSQHPTGFWAEELIVAHRELTAAGHSLTIATPGGVVPTVDPGSMTPENAGSSARVDEFAAYLAEIDDELEHPAVLADVDLGRFDAIVLPGGHGPMADLATDPDLGRLLVAANTRGILIAPFCHGPAGLLSAVTADGGFAFAGRRVTVFSDAEELAGGLGKYSPWLVASTLAERGAVLDVSTPWKSHVVIDDNLVSGQNPQSSGAVAAAVITWLAHH